MGADASMGAGMGTANEAGTVNGAAAWSKHRAMCLSRCIRAGTRAGMEAGTKTGVCTAPKQIQGEELRLAW